MARRGVRSGPGYGPVPARRWIRARVFGGGHSCFQGVLKLPTDTKRQSVAKLAELMGRSTVVIATDLSGLKANHLTELRRRLREHQSQYRVVKNRLAVLAAKEIGQEALAQLLQGSTGIVFGYGEPTETARALDEFVKTTRSTMKVRNGLLDGLLMSEQQIASLAAVPPRNVLVSMLLGQLLAPVTRLLRVLGGPPQGLVMVLQRRAEQLAAAGPG